MKIKPAEHMKTFLLIAIVVAMMCCVVQAEEKDYPLKVRVVGVFASYGPLTCCETVTIKIGTQEYILLNGYAPHHLDYHGGIHRSGKCLTSVRLGDDIYAIGPFSENKKGKNGPISDEGNYLYFKIMNLHGQKCDAAVLGVGESSLRQSIPQ